MPCIYIDRTLTNIKCKFFPFRYFFFLKIWPRTCNWRSSIIYTYEVSKFSSVGLNKKTKEKICVNMNMLCYYCRNFEESYQDKVASAASFTLIEAGLCSFSPLCLTSCSCRDLLPEIPNSTISNTSTKQSWSQKEKGDRISGQECIFPPFKMSLRRDLNIT